MHTTTAALTPDKLGDILVRDGLITADQLKRALAEQRSSGMRLGYTLVKLGFIDETEITKMLARQYRMPAVDLSRFEVDPKILKLISSDIAAKYAVLPLKREGRTLTIAIADPNNVAAIEDIKFITRCDIFPVIAGEYTLRNAIDRYYQQSDAQLASLLKSVEDENAEDLEVVEEQQDEEVKASELAEDAPVVKLINGLLTDAVKRGASDIHIEPFEHEMRVRYRVDGALQEVMKPPIKMRAALTSRVKIMAQLNIAERRVPQDGRIKLKMGARVIDFRVSTLPVLFGEKIVLRILDKGNLTFDLSSFGFEPKAEADLMKAILNPYGMVLVTGPTGSGKTTTLYSALSKINTIEVNIMTAEDPVEYNLMGINQVLVRNEVGMTFAAALKAFLRQDPEHHHGGGDPRSGDGVDRDQGRAHGPSRALDAAHQRRAVHRDPHDRHGDRAVQRGERREPHRGPAARAARVCGLQAGARVYRRGDARLRHHPRSGSVLQGGRLRHLQWDGLQGPAGPVRSHGLHLAAAPLHSEGCLHGRAARGRRLGGHVDAPDGRNGEGQAGRHHVGRGREGNRRVKETARCR